MSTVVAERPKNQTMADRLEASIDRKAAGDISVSAKNGMVMENMTQVMEFSKLMSLGREAIPKHLRENPGACLAICIQAYEWQISPFALANKSYVVNDRLAYEASLYQAVVTRRAPIRGRIRMEYEGEGNNRTCRVWAELADDTGIVDYTSPKFGSINPKNSPLWKNDPDQQLFYFSVRSFARRHFPDVMMGIYTVDEMQDASEALTAVRTAPITLDSLTSPRLVTPQAVEAENDQGGSDQHANPLESDRQDDPPFELQSEDRREPEPASRSQPKSKGQKQMDLSGDQSRQAPAHDREFFLKAVSEAKTVDALDSIKEAAQDAWEQGPLDRDDVQAVQEAITKRLTQI